MTIIEGKIELDLSNKYNIITDSEENNIMKDII